MKQPNGIMRCQKIKCSEGGKLSGRIAHNLRENLPENVDAERIELNEVFGAKTREQIFARVREQWEKATTRRSDNVGVLEFIITTTGELPQGEEKDFIADTEKQLAELYGAENLINYAIHRDEKEVHIHAFVVPLETKKIEKTRLTKAEEEQLKVELKKNGIEFQSVPKKPGKNADPELWEKYKKLKKDYEIYKQQIKPILENLGFSKSETILNAQKICADKLTMSHWQDVFYENVFKKYGLARGEKFYEKNEKQKKYSPPSLKKWNDSLIQQTKDLELDQENFYEKVKQFSTEVEKLNKAKKEFLAKVNYNQRVQQTVEKMIAQKELTENSSPKKLFSALESSLEVAQKFKNENQKLLNLKVEKLIEWLMGAEPSATLGQVLDQREQQQKQQNQQKINESNIKTR